MKKIIISIYKSINKIVKILSFNKLQLSPTSRSRNEEIFHEIEPLICAPFRREFENKIVFVDFNYEILKDIHLKIPNESDYIKLNNLWEFEKIKKILNYKIIVVTSELRFLDKVSKKHQKVVCIWHALGAFKKIGKFNKTVITTEKQMESYESYFDYLIVSSNNIIPFYSDSLNIDKSNVLSLGLPQYDKFFDKKIINNLKESFHKKYEFLKNKKIYGIFPTFQQTDLGINWSLNFEKLAKELNDDEVIVFKLHPLIPIEKSNFKEIKNKIINLSNEKDLLLSCDFDSILTDYSSVIYEAMIFNISLNFVKNPDIQKERESYIDYESLPGNKIGFDKSVEKNILYSFRNKCKDEEKYKNFYDNNLNSCDGNSTERVLEFLKNLLFNN